MLRRLPSILLPLFLFLTTLTISGQANPPTDLTSPPVRMILLLDCSGSMCDDFANQCCAEGDGSGLCMFNDPTNQRVEAAHRFIDSLRLKMPEAEVSVIVFAERSRIHAPLSIKPDSSIKQIHEWIDGASCEASNQDIRGSTRLGQAIAHALELADASVSNFASSTKREILFLTDGAWRDSEIGTPQEVIADYQTKHPDRTIPVIHGVFLTDSILHIQHAYPPEGCQAADTIDRYYLDIFTQLTNGIYIPNATPQSIVSDLLSLLDDITGVATPQPEIKGSGYRAQPDAVFTIHTSVDNRSIECSLHLPQPDHVRISMYSISGKQIAVPADHYQNAGEHRYPFDGSDLTDGCYFVKCEVGMQKFSRNLTILH